MEKRQFPRQRTLLGARLVFGSNNAYDCVITNLSPKGARIRCSGSLSLPARMTLQIPAQGQNYHVNAIWKTHDGLGLSFVAENSPEKPIVKSMGRLLAHLDQ